MTPFYHTVHQMSLFPQDDSKPSTRPDYDTLYALYVTERLTTRQISEKLGFKSKTSVLNWLKSYGIPPRDAHNGLLNRGFEPPSKEELIHLMHVEHKGYREIAEVYQVDHTAVTYWIKKYGIKPPTVWETRRKGEIIAYPTQEELRKMYLEDGMTLKQIADQYNLSQFLIANLCRKSGITIRPDGFNGGIRFACSDGHLVRSTYEQRVDNWLHEHNIPHEYEPRLPCDPRYDSDFLAKGWYIEVWGVQNSKEYAQRKAKKIALYNTHQIPLIQLSIDSFQPRRKDSWIKRLLRLL